MLHLHQPGHADHRRLLRLRGVVQGNQLFRHLHLIGGGVDQQDRARVLIGDQFRGGSHRTSLRGITPRAVDPAAHRRVVPLAHRLLGHPPLFDLLPLIEKLCQLFSDPGHVRVPVLHAEELQPLPLGELLGRELLDQLGEGGVTAGDHQLPLGIALELELGFLRWRGRLFGLRDLTSGLGGCRVGDTVCGRLRFRLLRFGGRLGRFRIEPGQPHGRFASGRRGGGGVGLRGGELGRGRHGPGPLRNRSFLGLGGHLSRGRAPGGGGDFNLAGGQSGDRLLQAAEQCRGLCIVERIKNLHCLGDDPGLVVGFTQFDQQALHVGEFVFGDPEQQAVLVIGDNAEAAGFVLGIAA